MDNQLKIISEKIKKYIENNFKCKQTVDINREKIIIKLEVVCEQEIRKLLDYLINENILGNIRINFILPSDFRYILDEYADKTKSQIYINNELKKLKLINKKENLTIDETKTFNDIVKFLKSQNVNLDFLK